MTGKKSFRDQQIEIQQALAAQEAMFGDLRIKKGARQLAVYDIPPKREMHQRTATNDTEAAVMVEVKEVLRLHPKVLFAIRQNSGETEYGTSADPRRVRYYDWIKLPPEREVTVTDCWGLLTDGRMFAIECKRRSWKMIPSDYRAQRQLHFIQAVIAAGGAGGFATCAQEAMHILESA